MVSNGIAGEFDGESDCFPVMKMEVLSVLKKLNYILNIVAGSFIGVFTGCGIYTFWDYRTHPGLYAMQSAPWYTGIFMDGIVILILLAVLIIVKLIIRKKIKSAAE